MSSSRCKHETKCTCNKPPRYFTSLLVVPDFINWGLPARVLCSAVLFFPLKYENRSLVQAQCCLHVHVVIFILYVSHCVTVTSFCIWLLCTVKSKVKLPRRWLWLKLNVVSTMQSFYLGTFHLNVEEKSQDSSLCPLGRTAVCPP